MTDNDLLLSIPDLSFGSGVVGVCDICKKRQAIVILEKERFKLCVQDFLNKTWAKSGATPGAPLPPYRSERVMFPTSETPSGKAPAVVLRPTKVVRHPVVLITPDVFGLTTALLDGAIRFAREGFEVLLPDLQKSELLSISHHLALRRGPMTRRGVDVTHPRVRELARLYADALAYLRTREMVDPEKSAVFGASYGSALAIAVAAQDPALSAVALAYPVPIRPPEFLAMLSAPTLVVGALKDRLSWESRLQFMDVAEPKGVRVEYAAVAGVKANFLSRDLKVYRMKEAEAAWRRIVEFLRSRLLPPPPKPLIPPTVAGPAKASPPPLAPTSARPTTPTPATAGAA